MQDATPIRRDRRLAGSVGSRLRVRRHRWFGVTGGYAIHRLVGSALGWASYLLAGGTAAGTRSQRRSALGWGRPTDIVPKPFNVRTRVHEYGGGAWTVALGVLYFSNFADGRLYRIGPGKSEPAPLTPAPPTRDRHWRFADGILDHGRHLWIGVRKDHTEAGQPVNAIVALDLAQSGTAAGHIIAAGHDFVASPRLSPDGRRLAWLAWDHPNMPWNGTILYVAALDENGAIIGAARRIAGGPAESIFQPEWSPDSTDLFFVSDRSGWWNLY